MNSRACTPSHRATRREPDTDNDMRYTASVFRHRVSAAVRARRSRRVPRLSEIRTRLATVLSPVRHTRPCIASGGASESVSRPDEELGVPTRAAIHRQPDTSGFVTGSSLETFTIYFPTPPREARANKSALIRTHGSHAGPTLTSFATLLFPNPS